MSETLNALQRDAAVCLLKVADRWLDSFSTGAIAELASTQRAAGAEKWINVMGNAIVARQAAFILLGFPKASETDQRQQGMMRVLERLLPQIPEAPIGMTPDKPEFYSRAVEWAVPLLRQMVKEEIGQLSDAEIASLLRVCDPLLGTTVLTGDLSDQPAGYRLIARLFMMIGGSLAWSLAEKIHPLEPASSEPSSLSAEAVDELERGWPAWFDLTPVWVPRTIPSPDRLTQACRELKWSTEGLDENNPVADVAQAVVKELNLLLEKKLQVAVAGV